MSHYSKIKTKITSRKSLVKALMRMGFKENQIEIHDEATNLYGYQGDKRDDVANVIIRRKNVGAASNDLGFVLDEDGTYRAIISDYDSHKYNKKWLNNLSTGYGVEQSLDYLHMNGWDTQETVNEQGEIQVVGIQY